MEKLLKLADVLIYADTYSWADSLFLPQNMDWGLGVPCAVLNMDNLDDNEEIPQFAAQNHLTYALGIQAVQDIVNNARQQRPNCSEEFLFKAFLYYYKNDAFLP